MLSSSLNEAEKYNSELTIVPNGNTITIATGRENVKAILVSQGANASQLTTVGEGEDKEFKNSQVSSHQLARRVVFRVK